MFRILLFLIIWFTVCSLGAFIFISFRSNKSEVPKNPDLTPFQYKVVCKLYNILKGESDWKLSYNKTCFNPNEYEYLFYERGREKLHVSAFYNGVIEVSSEGKSKFDIAFYEPDLAKRLISAGKEVKQNKLDAFVDGI